MKKSTFLLLLIIVSFGCKNEKVKNENPLFPALTGKYLGQKPPGSTPELFAPNIVSTGMYELNAMFSPDYSEFYFSISLFTGQIVIMVMKNINDVWSKPEVVSFSGQYADADPFITKDNEWLYFCSRRPIDSTVIPKDDYDIWRVERLSDMWGEPQHLDTNVNSEFSDEVYPTISDDGTLYFSSGRDNASKGKDIFYSEWDGNKFSRAKRLSGIINDYSEGDVYVSPNEDFLIVSIRGREEGNGLFISYNKNNVWSTPIHLGDSINMTGWEYCPMLTPDSKYLFFASSKNIYCDFSDKKMNYQDIVVHYDTVLSKPQNRYGDIYWVDACILDKFKPE